MQQQTPIKPRPSKSGHHYSNLGARGAVYVATTKMTETHLKLGHAVESGDVLISYGANGLGKSVANRLAAFDWSTRLGLDLFAVHAAALRQSNMLPALLAGDLGITEARQTWRTAYMVQAALAQRRAILMIDEASYLDRNTLGWLRDIHSDGQATWTLQLCGNPSLRRKLEEAQPELLDRADRVIIHEAMPATESVVFAHALHARFAATPTGALDIANTKWAQGRARRWAQLLKACLDVSPNGRSGFSSATIGTAMKLVAR